MFEKASRMKLRFETSKGALSAEDLWDLPLTSTTGKACLDDAEKAARQALREGEFDVSFVNPGKKSDEVAQLRLDILRHVITVKVAENAAATKARENAERKQRILALIADKEDKALGEKSIEELRALVGAS